MNLLLDTHSLLWFLNGDSSLAEKSIKAIENKDNNCFVSIGSLWEIAIKISLKKLQITGEFDQIIYLLYENEIKILPVSFVHVQELVNMPFYHRDPFDRLIIAQAISEELILISKDRVFERYDVELLWN